MSSETASFMDDPENAILVAEVSTPEVPSNTCRTSTLLRGLSKLIADLNNGLFTADFEDLTSTHGAIGKGELDDLVV